MPAINAYSQGQSLKNIVDDCERQCDQPKYNLDPATNLEPIAGSLKNAPGYRWLLDILRSLYLLHDWPFLVTAKTLTMTTGSPSVSLPPEYWRNTQDVFLWIISDSGGRTPVTDVDRETFFANEPANTDQKGLPRYCYIDRNHGAIFLNPIPDKNYLAELHYQQLPIGVKVNVDGAAAAPEAVGDVPWFPHHDYLKAALLVQYYLSQDDGRAASAEQMRMSIFQKIRGANFERNEGGRSSFYTGLDNSIFRNPPSL